LRRGQGQVLEVRSQSGFGRNAAGYVQFVRYKGTRKAGRGPQGEGHRQRATVIGGNKQQMRRTRG